MSYINRVNENTVEITHDMSPYVKSLPTLKQWSLWLALTRPDYAKTLTVGNMKFVMFTCIGCGSQFNEYPNSYRSRIRPDSDGTYKVRIGGTVRMQDETKEFVEGEWLIERRWLPRPVVKRGLGCATCLDLFYEEENKAATHNSKSVEIDTIKSKLVALGACRVCGLPRQLCKCEKFHPHVFKAARRGEAKLMMLQDQKCEDCKDTFYVWDENSPRHQERLHYVLCGCYSANAESL